MRTSTSPTARASAQLAGVAQRGVGTRPVRPGVMVWIASPMTSLLVLGSTPAAADAQRDRRWLGENGDQVEPAGVPAGAELAGEGDEVGALALEDVGRRERAGRRDRPGHVSVVLSKRRPGQSLSPSSFRLPHGIRIACVIRTGRGGRIHAEAVPDGSGRRASARSVSTSCRRSDQAGLGVVACGRYCAAPASPRRRRRRQVAGVGAAVVEVRGPRAPSGCWEMREPRSKNVMTSSMPVKRTWRRVIRLTLCSLFSGGPSPGEQGAQRQPDDPAQVLFTGMEDVMTFDGRHRLRPAPRRAGHRALDDGGAARPTCSWRGRRGLAGAPPVPTRTPGTPRPAWSRSAARRAHRRQGRASAARQ